MKNCITNVRGMKISYLFKDNHAKDNKMLIFLHGWGQSKEIFLPVIEGLNTKRNILVVDLPGFGQSQQPTEESFKSDYITEFYADVILELLDTFSTEDVILVSHSFGGRLSFWMAKKSKKITKMLLTGAAGIKPKRRFSYYLKVYGFKFQKLILKTPFYKQYKEDILSSSGGEDYKNANEVMKKVLIKTVNEDLKFLFPFVKQKVVLFWGIDDDATPLEDGKYMNENLGNSNLIQVKGSHYAFLEEKDLFIKEIKKLEVN